MKRALATIVRNAHSSAELIHQHTHNVRVSIQRGQMDRGFAISIPRIDVSTELLR